jgi:hypothetical protein
MGNSTRTALAVVVVLVSFVVASPGAFAARAKPTTWQKAVKAATATRPRFTPLRHVRVTTVDDFWAAWNRIAPGDEIDVDGVHFSGEITLTNVSLPRFAEVRFERGTTFSGVSDGDLPAVWLKQDAHVRFVGGTVTNPHGSAGILVYDSSWVDWYGFTIRDTGGSGLMVQGITRPNDHLDFAGDISRWGLDLGLDPHAEKGTGLHGALLADAYHGVQESRFVLSLHDGSTGDGVEAGGARPTDLFRSNVLDLSCARLTMRAVSQVAGNCLELWGQNVTGNVVGYLSGSNLEGRALDANGMDTGQSLATNRVRYAQALSTNLNPFLGRTESAVAAANPFDPRFGTIFEDLARS